MSDRSDSSFCLIDLDEDGPVVTEALPALGGVPIPVSSRPACCVLAASLSSDSGAPLSCRSSLAGEPEGVVSLSSSSCGGHGSGDDVRDADDLADEILNSQVLPTPAPEAPAAGGGAAAANQQPMLAAPACGAASATAAAPTQATGAADASPPLDAKAAAALAQAVALAAEQASPGAVSLEQLLMNVPVEGVTPAAANEAVGSARLFPSGSRGGGGGAGSGVPAIHLLSCAQRALAAMVLIVHTTATRWFAAAAKAQQQWTCAFGRELAEVAVLVWLELRGTLARLWHQLHLGSRRHCGACTATATVADAASCSSAAEASTPDAADTPAEAKGGASDADAHVDAAAAAAATHPPPHRLRSKHLPPPLLRMYLLLVVLSIVSLWHGSRQVAQLHAAQRQQDARGRDGNFADAFFPPEATAAAATAGAVSTSAVDARSSNRQPLTASHPQTGTNARRRIVPVSASAAAAPTTGTTRALTIQIPNTSETMWPPTTAATVANASKAVATHHGRRRPVPTLVAGAAPTFSCGASAARPCLKCKAAANCSLDVHSLSFPIPLPPPPSKAVVLHGGWSLAERGSRFGALDTGSGAAALSCAAYAVVSSPADALPPASLASGQGPICSASPLLSRPCNCSTSRRRTDSDGSGKTSCGKCQGSNGAAVTTGSSSSSSEAGSSDTRTAPVPPRKHKKNKASSCGGGGKGKRKASAASPDPDAAAADGRKERSKKTKHYGAAKKSKTKSKASNEATRHKKNVNKQRQSKRVQPESARHSSAGGESCSNTGRRRPGVCSTPPQSAIPLPPPPSPLKHSAPGRPKRANASAAPATSAAVVNSTARASARRSGAASGTAASAALRGAALALPASRAVTLLPLPPITRKNGHSRSSSSAAVALLSESSVAIMEGLHKNNARTPQTQEGDEEEESTNGGADIWWSLLHQSGGGEKGGGGGCEYVLQRASYAHTVLVRAADGVWQFRRPDELRHVQPSSAGWASKAMKH